MNIIEATKAMIEGKKVYQDGQYKSFSIGVRQMGRSSYIIYDDDSEWQPTTEELLADNWVVDDE